MSSLARRWSLVLFLAALSCSAKRLEPVIPRPTDQLSFVEVDGGLRLAIEPLLDGRASEKQYGLDFLDEGILAVRVVAQNRDPEASYLLLPQLVTVTASGADPQGAVGENPASGTTAAAAALAASVLYVAGTASVVTAPLLVPALPLMVWSSKKSADLAVIRYQLLVDSLYATTLSPAEEARGLVLLSHPEEAQGEPAEVCVCYTNLTEPRTDKACFPLAAVRTAR